MIHEMDDMTWMIQAGRFLYILRKNLRWHVCGSPCNNACFNWIPSSTSWPNTHLEGMSPSWNYLTLALTWITDPSCTNAHLGSMGEEGTQLTPSVATTNRGVKRIDTHRKRQTTVNPFANDFSRNLRFSPCKAWRYNHDSKCSPHLSSAINRSLAARSPYFWGQLFTSGRRSVKILLRLLIYGVINVQLWTSTRREGIFG